MTQRVVITGGTSWLGVAIARFVPELADKARIGFWQRLRSKIED